MKCQQISLGNSKFNQGRLCLRKALQIMETQLSTNGKWSLREMEGGCPFKVRNHKLRQLYPIGLIAALIQVVC